MMQFNRLKELRDVFNSIHNGVVIIDKAGKIVVYNKAAAMMLEKAPGEISGKHIRDVSPDAWDDLKRILEDGRPQIGKKIALGRFTIIANRTPIIRSQEVVGVVSVFQDISDYEGIAEQLESYKRVNKELNGIINSSFDGLWICDHEGKVVQINRASEKINSIRAEEVIGKSMETLIRQGMIDRSVSLEVLKKRTGVTMIQSLKNGRQILVTGNPVRDDKGEIYLVVVNERDITNLNRLRNELDESKALAQRYRSELSLKSEQVALLDGAVFRSEVMARVIDRAMRVAQVDSTVLIQGESGVGKGFMAGFIHRASPRRKGPFIRVDCGAIPESLIESELFGYEKGAFTGALRAGKSGQFELAEGGTLFLDEIGDLPHNVQVKLLRFLEDNEIVRIGSRWPRTINTRVIAATNRRLDRMVVEGAFRKDLFFRLNVVPIHVPPLKDRIDDVPVFVYHFLRRLNDKYTMKKFLSRQAMDCLCRYSFPGNIRELSNLMEQLVVLTQGDRISLDDLPSHLRMADEQLIDQTDVKEWNLSNSVQQVEKMLISKALKKCGTQRKAAQLLGINQSTLARKAMQYGINRDAILHLDT
jgi:PAS domain S-box-containing protein